MREEDREKLISALRTSGLGLDAFSVEREVLRYLPDGFLFRYELLWLRAYGAAGGAGEKVADPDAAVVGTKRVTRVSTGQTETRGGAHAGHRMPGVGTKVIVRDDRAFRIKQRVDRKLRALAREIGVYLSDDGGVERAGVRRCTRPTCRKWAEESWTFCPWDGAPTEEVN
jgi:hypothetical protein